MMEDYIFDFPSGDIAQNKYVIHKLLLTVCFTFLSIRLLLDLAERFAEDGSTMEQFGLPKPQGVDTEVDRERLRWNSVAEEEKFTHLCLSSPNTEEMAALFAVIKNAIDKNLTLIIYIQGEYVRIR